MSGARLAACEEASELGGGEDRHAAVLRRLEVFVTGDEVLRRGFCRQQIKKHTISGIANGGCTGDGDDQISLDSKVGQKSRRRDRRVREVSLDRRAVEYVLQFSQGGLAHHGHHLPHSDGVEDLRGWAGHGHQPGHEDVGIKDDAHDAFALPRPLRQFAQG